MSCSRAPGREPPQASCFAASGKVTVQDKFACYSQGQIADRTQQHLGRTDAGVALVRRLYFKAMEAIGAGRDPLGVVREPICEIVRFDKVF